MGPGSSGPGRFTAFEEHLQSCEQCQAVVAEFEPVVQEPQVRSTGGRAAGRPEARTIAAVQYAVMTESQPGPAPAPTVATATPEPKPARRESKPLVAPPLDQPSAFRGHRLGRRCGDRGRFHRRPVSQVAAPAVAASFSLQAQPGQSGSATAVARHVNGGWEIQLTVKHLKKLRPGQFYECWYAGPDNGPGTRS